MPLWLLLNKINTPNAKEIISTKKLQIRKKLACSQICERLTATVTDERRIVGAAVDMDSKSWQKLIRIYFDFQKLW